eukprot:516104-Rhodomonas_salina.1
MLADESTCVVTFVVCLSTLQSSNCFARTRRKRQLSSPTVLQLEPGPVRSLAVTSCLGGWPRTRRQQSDGHVIPALRPGDSGSLAPEIVFASSSCTWRQCSAVTVNHDHDWPRASERE